MGQVPRTIAEADLAELLATPCLQLPRPVVVVIGGAADLDRDEQAVRGFRSEIERMMVDAVRPAVAEAHAVVLTGGTKAGVMRIAGEVLADVATALIGVVPAVMVDGDKAEAELDPRHTTAILTPGTRWGSETETLFQLAEDLTMGIAPGIVILANGGAIAFEEARRFLRGGWPIITVTASGGAAEELMDAAKLSARESKWGDLRQADVESLSPDRMTARRQVAWRLHHDELLKSAWVTYASYDQKAIDLKRASMQDRRLLAISASALLTAITLMVQFAVVRWASIEGQVDPQLGGGWQQTVLPLVLAVAKWLVLVLPIGIAVAAALGSFAGSHAKWRSVRASAETLKREIYRYRARTVDGKVATAGDRLAAVLHVVDDEAIHADVGLAETPPGVVRGRPANVDLDELEALNARIYIKRRLEQQIMWFGDALLVKVVEASGS